jgi:ribosomal protein L11 methyltransferase
MLVWSKVISVDEKSFVEERFLSMAQTNAVIKRLSGSQKLQVEVYLENEKEAHRLKKELGGKVNKLEYKNWAKINASSNRPLIKIRDKILITDNSDSKELKKIKIRYPKKIVISIPAALAFGTGDHATTSTCLRMLVDIAKDHQKKKKQWSLCDIGSGTGILPITASLMGAFKVEGFDFDPEAIVIAKRNMVINSIDGINIYEQDLFDWSPKKGKTWDVITANIFANVLNPNLKKIWSLVSQNGHLLLSGILKEHHDSILKNAKSNGLPIPELHCKGKWVSFKFNNC